MAELLSSYAANEILKKVQSFVTDTITGAWGLKDDLEKLSDSTGRLQSLLQKVVYAAAEAIEDDESIKRWLQKLQEVVYAAADVLDEFHYEILRRKVEVKNQLKRKVREFVSRNNPILFRVNMATKVKEVSESLADMEKQAPVVLLTITIPAMAVAAQREVVLDSRPDRRTDSFLGESERPIGRTEEVERIIKMLQVSSVDLSRLSVISIVGFGGLGKTTLAQLVCEEAKKKKLFDELIWVCVSEPFDIQKILGEMLQKLDNTTGGLSSMDVIVGKLQQQLKDKRFLVVLDDVWNKESEKWENLKRRLGNICGKSGNFVIATTRSSDIATIMESKHVEELKQLSDTKCWSIIKDRVVGNEGESIIPHDMETIGMEIARKCGGVPLAAKVIGGVLSSRNNKAEWLSIQHSNVWNEVDKGERISGVLKLSFDHLLPPQKLCFAYCSRFPKDFVFEKAHLIQLWMAEDFLKTTLTNGGKSAKLMEDVGEEYFHSLLDNSFFQEAQVDDCGNIVRCKMHDLLHELALSISKPQSLQCGSNCFETSSGRRLNFSCDQVSEVQKILESSKEKTRNLRSLFSRVDISPMLSNFRRLRSLDMSDSKLKNLPSIIRKLKHLRYLDISENESIEVLPESITKLYNLQTLRVFQCYSLEELPRKIINLVSLRHIGFDDERLVPLKVGCLTNLQTLPFFVVGLQKGQTINELEELNELRGEMVICDLENVRDKEEAERAKMKEKKLSKLVLQWMKLEENEEENFSSSREGNHEEVMEGLEASTMLQSLTIEWYMGKQFPQWMSQLNELVKLTLKNCRRCVTMPTLGHLPNLKVLVVKTMDSVKSIGSEFCGESNNVATLFPLLEEFSIRKMKSLVEWVTPKGTEIFPKLRKLYITDCPYLTSFPLSQPSSAIYMRSHNSSMGEGSEKILCFLDFKSLQDIWIEGCPKLTFLHVGLKDLHIHLIHRCNFSQQQEDLVKKLSLCSNELGGSWKITRIAGVIEKIREFPKSLEALEIEMFDSKLSVEAFHGLSCLKHLVIRYCYCLESIPTLSSLTSLKHLQITGCPRLESIPTLSSLTSLKHLQITGCHRVESIPILSSFASLEHIEIENCYRLESIPTLYSPTSLKHLQINFCPRLESIPALSSLTTLKHLQINFCNRLESIPTLSSLTPLEHLEIESCNRLESIPTLSSLNSLKHLQINRCYRLESIPTISSLTSLQTLIFGFRSNLQLDFLSTLTCLKELYISNCDNLLISCQSLKKLVIQWCGKLSELSLKSFSTLTCLEDLSISHCDNLRNLPAEIKLCTSLKELKVAKCREMVSIADDIIGSLFQLKKLEWGRFSEDLDQVPGLNSIHLLTSLQKIKIIGWDKLTSLPHQLQRLTSITELAIWYFDGVESLPDWLCNLSSLQSLSISCCENLKNLPTAMQRLSKLTTLDICYCPLLEERCVKDIGPERSNICHIPYINIDDEVIQDLRSGTNAEISI